MAFAPTTTYFDVGDGTILGCFEEKDHGHYFEFSVPTEPAPWEEYGMWVWVGNAERRWAKVLKTVAYIVVNEDENGPVVEKWYIKNHREYAK